MAEQPVVLQMAVWTALEHAAPAFVEKLRSFNGHFFHEEFEYQVDHQTLKFIAQLIRYHGLWKKDEGFWELRIPDPHSARAINVIAYHYYCCRPLTDDLNFSMQPVYGKIPII